jgi:hypothetical protein
MAQRGRDSLLFASKYVATYAKLFQARLVCFAKHSLLHEGADHHHHHNQHIQGSTPEQIAPREGAETFWSNLLALDVDVEFLSNSVRRLSTEDCLGHLKVRGWRICEWGSWSGWFLYYFASLAFSERAFLDVFAACAEGVVWR